MNFFSNHLKFTIATEQAMIIVIYTIAFNHKHFKERGGNMAKTALLSAVFTCFT